MPSKIEKVFSRSPFSRNVKIKDREEKLGSIEIKDFTRGFCGALFFALPLHFTMEMWERAKVIPDWDIALIIVGTFFVNIGFLVFSGYKPQLKRQAEWFDALGSMGIGLLASTITLFLIDQLSYDMPFETIAKVITLQMVPTSFGASLAKSQLGAKGNKQDDDVAKLHSDDFKKIVGALLGSLLFAFNIAATYEPIVITTSIQWFQIIGLICFSLFVSFLMIFVANFIDRDNQTKGIMGAKWAETVVSYAISLIVSAGLLWMFGYLGPDTPWVMALSWTVVLGYCTSLGSAAGRLIIT